MSNKEKGTKKIRPVKTHSVKVKCRKCGNYQICRNDSECAISKICSLCLNG